MITAEGLYDVRLKRPMYAQHLPRRGWGYAKDFCQMHCMPRHILGLMYYGMLSAPDRMQSK